MDNMRICRAAHEDIDDIIQMSDAMAHESGKRIDPAELKAGVRAVFDEPRHNSCYFVAVSEGKVVAMLLLTREWSDHRNAHNAWIRRLYVREGFRHRGIATALLEHVIFTGCGVIEFKFNVYLGNDKSIRLFERLGGCFDAVNGTLVIDTAARHGTVSTPIVGRRPGCDAFL